MDPDSFRRDSKSPLYWAYCSEDKKDSRDQDKRRSQKKKTCKRGE